MLRRAIAFGFRTSCAKQGASWGSARGLEGERRSASTVAHFTEAEKCQATADALKFVRPQPPDEQTFVVEVNPEAKRGRAATCRCCGLRIEPGSLRVGLVTASGSGDFSFPVWSHVECFRYVFLRHFPEQFASSSRIEGLLSLPVDDFHTIASIIVAAHDGVPRVDSSLVSATQLTSIRRQADARKELEIQLNQLDSFALEEAIKSTYGAKILADVTRGSKSKSKGSLVDVVADFLAFGPLEPCGVCGGLLVARRDRYQCTGFIDEFTRCTARVSASDVRRTEPKKRVKECLYPEQRVLDVGLERPKDAVSHATLPLFGGMSLWVPKSMSKAHKASAATFEQLGGTVVDSYSKTIPSPQEYLWRRFVGGAVKATVPEVQAEWVHHCARVDTRHQSSLEQTFLGFPNPDNDFPTKVKTWRDKINAKQAEPTDADAAKKKKLVVKDGAAVDPECDDADLYAVVTTPHVFSAALSSTDIGTGKNSYYILQLLRRGSTYAVFRRWGRTGDDMKSGKTLTPAYSQAKAEEIFCKVFEEKTGNDFKAVASNTKPFAKVAGKMNYVPQDFSGQVTKVKAKAQKKDDESSKVITFDKPTRRLLERMFDTETMSHSMQQMEIDTAKMPLGKLSAATLEAGRGCLYKINELLANPPKDSPKEKVALQIRSLTNQFYTFVPQKIPVGAATESMLINTLEKVSAKLDVVSDLIDITETMAIIDLGKQSTDPAVAHYRSLHAELKSLPDSDPMHKTITKAFYDTQADSHSKYSLEHIWELEREGETKRFEPWVADGNRKLLWHGSRFTNWVRIIAQGLRIAPPEAPVTGYMFGKGIYFADMMSKSANYTHIDRRESGLMALAEVALGKTYSPSSSDSSLTLASLKSKRSLSTAAEGETVPSDSVTLDGGLELHLGKPKRNQRSKCGLMYNEFIVYDVSQVRLRYLLSVKL